MMLQPEIEQMPRAEMRSLQTERLNELLAYVGDRVAFYDERMAAAGVRPGSIEQPEDISRLPLTDKDDLRKHYPFALFATPMDEVIRIHASSGTTGKATVVGYTREDIALFALVNARCLAMGGARPGMMLHNAYGYGLFTGGLGLHYGGERLGMTVVPVSGGMTQRQVTLIVDFGPQVICCTPSYALTLADALAAPGLDPSDNSLRYALCGAEPWTDTTRAGIDEGLGVTTTNIYGLSEIIGPGVSNECVEVRNGSHINEDHFLPEVVDPTTGEVLEEGAEGELVLTTLTKRALPLIRYNTKDICRLDYDRCGCGRTLVRMSQIAGRADDMLIIRGVNVYPSRIEIALGDIPELSAHHRIRLRREAHLDAAEVVVEVTPGYHAGTGIDGEGAEALRRKVAHAIKEATGVTVEVTLTAPGELPRSEGGKTARVEDLRDQAR